MAEESGRCEGERGVGDERGKREGDERGEREGDERGKGLGERSEDPPSPWATKRYRHDRLGGVRALRALDRDTSQPVDPVASRHNIE